MEVLWFLEKQTVRSYLSATRHRGGLVSRSIAITTAKALIKRNPRFNLDHSVFGNSWAKSIFSEWVTLDEQKLLLKYRFPKPFKKKQSLSSNKIAKIVQARQIPNCMILNLDQTPSKFVPSSNTTLAPRGTISIPVTGPSDKNHYSNVYNQLWIWFLANAADLPRNYRSKLTSFWFPEFILTKHESKTFQ